MLKGIILRGPVEKMSADQAIAFGDNVRVRSTELTEARGLAGLRGEVHGLTIVGFW